MSLKKEKEINGFKVVSPWVNYYREVEALFGKDPQIKIEFDEDAPEIKMYIDDSEKADAIGQLLPTEKYFGNVLLKITIIPANGLYESQAAKFRKAFEGNPVFVYAQTIEGIFANNINYIVFAKEVVQYYNDDLSDANGVRSTLYQDIAKDVFGERTGIFYCTDVQDPEAEKDANEI